MGIPPFFLAGERVGFPGGSIPARVGFPAIVLSCLGDEDCSISMSKSLYVLKLKASMIMKCMVLLVING